MKPVEIEFIMRDKLTSGLDKAAKSASDLGERAEHAAKTITARIAEQKEVIAHVEKDLKRLQKQYEAMSPGKAQLEMKAEIEACSKALAEEKAILETLEAEHSKASASTKRLSQELRQLQEAMGRMRLEGNQNSEEYRRMAERAAELADTIGDLRTQTNILANDDAGLQGVISGVNGLSGAFTAATGIMGVFASENENLAKIQTRVQSVMAITMGLQQVMNTLNKDSAFRLVTLTRAKNLLTSANTRLATSLGISNVAATALMGTLTLGLSLAVTAGIALWNRYADSQEKAAQKARELTEVETDARASVAKNRIEIELAKESLKDFTGTRAQEQAKVEELNRKYGESFGYYSTIAQWYDVLTEKGEAYVDMLIYQNEVQDLINKATETQKKLEQLRNQNPEDVKGAMGIFEKGVMYIAQMESQGQIDAGKIIEDHDAKNKAAVEKALEDELKGLKELISNKNKKAADIMKENGLGGFTPSATPTSPPSRPQNNLAELEAKAMQRIEDQKIALMREGYERERAEAALNFERDKERINDEETKRLELYDKLKAAGERLTPGQRTDISAQAAVQRTQAAALYDAAIAEIDEREKKEAEDRAERQRTELQDLIQKYADFEARRVALKASGDADIARLNAARTAENSTEIDRAIAEARKKIEAGLAEINDAEAAEATRGGDFMKRLFGDYAAMGYQELSVLMAQARELRAYLNGTGTIEGLTFISPEQLAAIEKSPSELDKLRKALDRLLDGNDSSKGGDKWLRIFGNIRKGLAGLGKANGPKGLAENISMISVSAGEAAGEIGTMLDAIGNTGAADALRNTSQLLSGIASIGQGFTEGGMVGGMTSAVGVITGFLTEGFAATARHKEALKEIQAAQLDFERRYRLMIIEQRLLMEDGDNIFGSREISKATNAVNVYREVLAALKEEMAGDGPEMNWFERITGDASGSYARKLAAYESGFGALAQAQIVTGHKKTGLFGLGKGKDTYSGLLEVYPELIKANGDLDTEMLRVILDTRKMSDETRNYLENLISLEEAVESAEAALEDYLKDTFGSLGTGIMDAVTAAVRGSEDALESLARSGAACLEDLGEQMAYSLFFADMFDDLQKQLKEAYGSGLGEEAIAEEAMSILGSFYDGIGNNINEAQQWMEAWKEKASEAGFELWSDDSSQSGKAGTFATLTQDQGTKLEGLFTSVRAHEASIDENVEDMAEGLATAVCHLRGIESNTGKTNEKLDGMAEQLDRIIREGIEVK